MYVSGFHTALPVSNATHIPDKFHHSLKYSAFESVCWSMLLQLTGVVGHGCLLAVPLLLKLDVAQLEDSGDHFQHA